MADALVDVLVALHEVDPGSVGLADYGRPEGFLERQIRRWNGQWEKSRTHDVPAVDELGRRLAAALPASRRSAIVHGDYRLDNCLMHPSDPGRVAAVLDWELSTLGDPMTDLGLLLFYWREPGEAEPSLTPAVTRTPGFPAGRTSRSGTSPRPAPTSGSSRSTRRSPTSSSPSSPRASPPGWRPA